MKNVDILIVDPDPKFRTRAVSHLNGQSTLEAEGLSGAERFCREQNGRAAVIVIGPSVGIDDAIALAEDTQEEFRGVGTVLVTPKVSTAVLRRALRAGLRDVLSSTCAKKEFVEAVERASQFSVQSAATVSVSATGGTKAPKVVTVFSAKGGSGKSVVSSNLAVLIAQRTGEQVALVDLDLESGDLAIMLQLAPTRTVYDAAQNIELLDPEALKGYMTPYKNGVDLLAAPLEPGLGEKITPETVRRIIEMLRESFQHVVIDGPSFFTDQILTALEHSDECILVGSLDVPSVKNMKIALRTLELLGLGRDRLRLVLNRADSKVGLGLEEVEKALKTNIEMLIPSSRDVPLCINRGEPVAVGAPRSGVTAAIGRLSEAVCDAAPEQTAPRTRRLPFGRR